MKLERAGLAGLTLLFGCVRVGYDVTYKAHDSGVDAGHSDMDSAVTVRDASQRDASDRPSVDAAISPRDAAQVDASTPHDAGSAHDASAARDAGAQRDAAVGGDASSASDAGQADAGAQDAAVSSKVPCSIAITDNRYVGKKHYHGYLTLQNTGTSTWTQATISFDLPSTMKICNDVDVLPGAGWTLQSSAGHCEYTKSPPTLSIAPGASLKFEYSSDYPDDIAAPAAANVSVVGCS